MCEEVRLCQAFGSINAGKRFGKCHLLGQGSRWHSLPLQRCRLRRVGVRCVTMSVSSSHASCRVVPAPTCSLLHQQLPAGHDLRVQGPFNAHELPVLTDHVLLQLLQGKPQLGELVLSILDNPVLLSLSDASSVRISAGGSFSFLLLFACALTGSELLNLPVCRGPGLG